MMTQTTTPADAAPVQPWLYRDGSPAAGTVTHNEAGKPGVREQGRCRRCGGAGGAEQWKMTGWTCYECAGSGKGPLRFVRVYTAEQLAKLDATKAKRDAKRAEQQAAAAAERQAQADARRASYFAEHAETLRRAGFAVADPFVAELMAKAEARGELTPNQTAALATAVERFEQHAARAAESRYFGAPGDKLRATVTVTGVASYERQPYRSFSGHTETVWIITMADAEGHVFVTKSPAFKEEKGETFTLTGTVKEHSEYRGVKQTVIQRAKRA